MEINILTSTDNNYVPHLFTQLKSIADNLIAKYEVHFWFFHYRILKSDIEELSAYADFLGIRFHEVFVFDFEDYNVLTKGVNHNFPIEAYFYFCAHKYLPETMERALYIDAGDVIFAGDIEEYYFAPFEGNFFIASMAKSGRKELYCFDDLYDRDSFHDIIWEYVNSGSIVLNLTLMRIFNIDLRFYENVIDFIIKNDFDFTPDYEGTRLFYCFDQGLFAAAFVGRIKFWEYEYFGYEGFHMPYNFRPFVFERRRGILKLAEDGSVQLPYEPRIIHFLQAKPWTTSVKEYRTLLPLTRKYLDIFWKAEAEAKRWRREYSERA
ncbi:MAG: hypothetical protein LBL98_08085 [Ruminococcus sp.]|jgi:lipopolysaccharide biosynthesis glycosyltransferase|nr:hypothetical protein [Ruminococcus sp.]